MDFLQGLVAGHQTCKPIRWVKLEISSETMVPDQDLTGRTPQVEEVRKMKIGNPLDQDTAMGCRTTNPTCRS